MLSSENRCADVIFKETVDAGALLMTAENLEPPAICLEEETVKTHFPSVLSIEIISSTLYSS